MAENPESWGPAERVVDQVLTDHAQRDPQLCGLSLMRRITDALRDAELLTREYTYRNRGVIEFPDGSVEDVYVLRPVDSPQVEPGVFVPRKK